MTDSVDPVTSALAELRAFGLLIDHLEIGQPAGGKKVHRVDFEGHKKGKRAGWYLVHEVIAPDGSRLLVGSYGVWEGADRNTQKLRVRGAKLDEFTAARIKRRQKEIREEAEASEQELIREVSERAQAIWKGLGPCGGDAPYLQKKGVAAFGLARGRNGVVVVPVRNTAGVIQQLQFIAPDGEKKFLTGPGKVGCYHLIGTVCDEMPLMLAEGYATAASIHMATGWPVAVCFDANNLIAVAQRLRPIYPDAQFVFAADDDHEKKSNAGRTVVVEGAKRFNGRVVFPRFTEPQGRTDFNDMAGEQGLEAVRDLLQQSFTPTLPAGASAIPEQWRRELVWTRTGLESMTQNVMVVLENHPDWRGVYAYNEFAKRLVKLRAPPFPGGKIGWVTDTDEIETGAWFGRRSTFASNISQGVARQAIIAVAERAPFHPIRDYLSGLRWDQEDRLDTFFADYCGVKQNETFAGFARNFFIAAVARIFQPGCKADLMLVLEGEQGARKSTLAAVLAGDGGYADVGTAPSDKDFFQIIQGVWIAEISEMASFVKAETSHIKRAISVSVDRFRKSYGHNVEEFKRECVFFGTANNNEWQRDETGGRRYMPVWVQDIDIDAVRLVRDQLWAEAVYRYQQGEPWHQLPAGAQEEQDARFVDDIWTERISAWLEGNRGDGSPNLIGRRIEATASDILTLCLDMDPKKQDRSAQTRVGNIMRRLGWRVRQLRVGGARIRKYERPTERAEVRP